MVVYDNETHVIETFFGKGLTRDTGFHCAERRLDTALERINSHFDAAIVPAGQFKKGDVLPDDLA